MNEQAQFPPELVRASAGTGKTFRLTNRFIALLAAGEKPERILATTFTKKAAGEVQERLFLRLAESSIDDKEASSLGSFIGDTGLNRDKAAELLGRLIHSQHRLRVCTLDSFFITIAKSFSQELGIPTNWELVEEIDDVALRLDALETVFSRNLETLPELVRLLQKGDARSSLHRQIAADIFELYGVFRGTNRETWDWLKVPQGLSPEVLKKQVKRLAEVELPLTKAGKPNSHWLKARDRDVVLLSKIGVSVWQDFIKQGIAKAVVQQARFHSVEVPTEIQEVYDPLIKHAKAILLGDLSRQTLATFAMLSLFEQSYETNKQLQGAFRFDDIKSLLAEESLLGELEQVYFRLDSQIAHLLLDEFQDTSRVEWSVLEPIAEEVLSKSGLEYSFFCVGDVKQAIYGWRGGVSEIFDALSDRFEMLDEKTLDVSYRSSEAVIDCVNQVFSQIESNAALSDFQKSALRWNQGFWGALH